MKSKEKTENLNKQMSDAFITNLFLALSGGFQDAYTYYNRNGVFSNAQTGNVVLMSENLMSGHFKSAIRFLIPILAFMAGIMVAEFIGTKYKNAQKIHWRQGVVAFEMLILFLVGFIPQNMNIIATVLVSLSCAMQVQAFRKVNGFPYASTMCIGNLRSGTEALCKFFEYKNSSHLKRAVHYFSIIFVFAIGAGFGGIISIHMGIHAIWFSIIFLLMSFMMMIKK